MYVKRIMNYYHHIFQFLINAYDVYYAIIIVLIIIDMLFIIIAYCYWAIVVSEL